MFTNSSSSNSKENFMNNNDVFTKTKQLKIGDNNKLMDKQDRDDKIRNENLYPTQDKKFIQKQQRSPEREIINDMSYKKNLNSYENMEMKRKIELDLSVPNLISDNVQMNDIDIQMHENFRVNENIQMHENFRVNENIQMHENFRVNENLGISARGMNSFMIKSPDFFKRPNNPEIRNPDVIRSVDVNNYKEVRNVDVRNVEINNYNEQKVNNYNEQKINNYNEQKINNYNEQKVNFENTIHDTRFNRNRSLHNATMSQGMSPSYFYQHELFNQYSGENDHIDGFYMSQVQDIKSQSNNLFGQPIFNKKRSYSEADLNKPNRNNPFSNFRRSPQFNDDFHKKSRPITDTCIDPRMFYKNICNSQINKENHVKPAFSYAQIITRALNNSTDGKLTLGEIYKWIEDNFEYYKFANPVWKNSIRHNLSLSKCFKKVAREPGTRGKGGKWMIDKEFIAQEENRKKRKSFEEENMMNHAYGVDNAQDPRFYQM